KTTLARLLLHLVVPDAGELVFDGDAVNAPNGLSVNALRRQVQMVFQDSYSSLNPRMPIRDSVAFGPFIQGRKQPEARDIARDILAKVGLDPDLFGPRYPHELSGGSSSSGHPMRSSPPRATLIHGRSWRRARRWTRRAASRSRRSPATRRTRSTRPQAAGFTRAARSPRRCARPPIRSSTSGTGRTR